jgi:gamma-glutamylcyclotransferase (GGCT)/AIG2-like uncharacterized protein YtfP
LTNKIIVFVYGTLKRGYGNFYRCLDDARFLGKAKSVEDNFVMQDIGFPILWQEDVSPVAGSASGEVFEITQEQLERCDQLEGHPHMYRREERLFKFTEKTAIDPLPGENIKAWVYLWRGKHNGDPIKPVSGALTWDRGGQRKARRNYQ